MQPAVKLSENGHEDEAKELLRIAAGFQEAEDKLAGYAEEVKVGRGFRGKLVYPA